MAPLAPRSGHRLLRCPICRLDLRVAAGALFCPNRHSFDLAREGYVNLLPGRRRRPANGGDRLEQLRHRAAFLEAGHFDFVAAAICSRLRQAAALPADRYWHILDAGCGTGHHPARIVAELGSSIVGLGLDIAGAAARRASRRWPGLAFAVADLWAEWPVHDAAVDLVISVFAPKNFGGDSAGPSARGLRRRRLSGAKSSCRTPTALRVDAPPSAEGATLCRGREENHRAANSDAARTPGAARPSRSVRRGPDGAQCTPYRTVSARPRDGPRLWSLSISTSCWHASGTQRRQEIVLGPLKEQ